MINKLFNFYPKFKVGQLYRDRDDHSKIVRILEVWSGSIDYRTERGDFLVLQKIMFNDMYELIE